MRLVTSFVFIFIFVACSPAVRSPALLAPPPVDLPAFVQQLTPDQAAALIQNTPDLVILDTREMWEIEQDGHLPKSVYVDYLNLGRFEEKTAKLDPAKSYFIYCAIGGRSELASKLLAARGFSHLALLTGGLDAWIKTGKPVEK